MDIISPDFEWDEAKRQSNIRKHGLDLLRGITLLDGRPVYTYASPRQDEVRFVSVGRLDANIVALVWTERPPLVRLISLRRARDAESRTYQASLR